MRATKLKFYTITTLTIVLGQLGITFPVYSQPITPAKDNTGTIINQNGNQFNIEGGTHNGSNLFHSFDEFNVKTNQTANFLTTPDTRNILGRVTGANASIINGLIQVIGSNSNLFLMNPAGIMFGPNARLNIPASFSVTTATGIGFNKNNFWFKAMETNDYSKLIGNPSGYRFNSEQLGQIVNQGNLSLNPGENLTLLGGTVINTGPLSSPGGKITIAAVEDSGMVRISQPGHLLSLEFDPNKVNEKDTSNLGSGFLAYVLTGGDKEHATSIRVDADGNVMLTNNASIDVSSSDHTGEQVHVLEDNVTIAHASIDVSSSDHIGGQVHVLGDRVSLVDANINADGLNGGGKVFIGGDLQSYGIVPNFQETFINQNSLISKVNADGNVTLKDHVTITNTSIDVSSSDNIGGQVDVLGDRVSLMDTNINADGLNGGGKVFIGGDLQSHGIVPNFQETFINQNSLISRVNADGNVMLKDHVTITNTSIDVSSSDNIGGQVDVLGDQVSLMDTNINADGLNGGGTVLIGGDFQGHGIGIVPNSQETFINQNSFISADAIRNGDGGQVNIWSDGITNFEGNISAKGGENSGDGGFVEVSGKQKLNFNAKVNVSAEFGNRGTILLDPEDIILGGPESNTSLENSEGDILLQADNDITINENIERDSLVKLQAGRSININADINTSGGDGDINLFGNNQNIDSPNRSDGAASINQLDGTTLNAGNGNINIQLGNLGEVGDINLANLITTGQILVNANGGNIARVSENSLITAGSGLFLTKDSGGIGLGDQPLRLNVNSLEAVAGNSGAFFELNSNSLNIGGVNEEVNGISTIAGGDIVLKSEGNVRVNEDIFTKVSDSEQGGNINITANNLFVANGSQISASTFGNGDAGKVDIKVVDTVTFDGVSSDGFASGTISAVGEGAAGNARGVAITTGSLKVTNGAQLSVITLGQGNVEAIDITANNVVFDGVSTNGFSGAFSIVGARAEGKAGGVNITSSSIEVISGAQIYSNTQGQGTAGNISIQTESPLIISEDSKISTFTESGIADRGNIIITYSETIDIRGSGSGNQDKIGTATAPISSEQSPATAPISSEQSPATAPISSEQSPATAPISSEQSPATAPISSEQSPATAPISSEQSPATAPISSEQSPATAPISSEQSPATAPISSEQSPATAPISSEQSPATAPISSEQSPATAPISSEQSPATAPISSEQSPATPPISSEESPLINSPTTGFSDNPQSTSPDLILRIITPSNNDQTANTPTAKDKTQGSINITTDTQTILTTTDDLNTNTLTVATNSNQDEIRILEQNLNKEYFNYFGKDFSKQLLNEKSTQEILKEVANQTGKASAVIYIKTHPERLELILYTKNENNAIIKTIPQAKEKELIKVVSEFRAYITSPSYRDTNRYLSPARQLYDWLIVPISKELEAANIKTILFSMDQGLRTLPIAALHDGKQFLIEKYSLSVIPSFSLTDTRYRNHTLQNTQILAMGASKFIEQEPLPSVPVELQNISQKLWQGSQFINEDFTKNNLLTQRQNYPYPIIHLATHAEFKPGKASSSYIQLWGSEQIKLDEMRELGWDKPTVELLVLSACRTAVGDKNAELGFAGLAIAAGVKSVLGSIWYVSDQGTLALMTEFYTHLNNAKIKAEALRQAQLAMLRGDVVIAEGNLTRSGGRRAVVLPATLRNLEKKNFSHPYYWSGFTMVGSPW